MRENLSSLHEATFPSDIKLQITLRRLSVFFCAAILLIAFSMLAGILLNIPVLKSPFRHFPPMNLAAALAFVFLVSSFFLLKTKSKLLRMVANVFAIMVAYIGFVRIFSFLLGYNSETQYQLFANRFNFILSFFNSRMAPPAAFCFIIGGISLLLITYETPRRRMPAHYLALLVAAIGFFSVLGILLQVKDEFGLVTILMSFYTGICFLLFSAAVLFTNPDKGVMKQFTTLYAGSAAARLLIPIALFVPITLRILNVYGQYAGFFSKEFGTALAAIVALSAYLALISYHASMLNSREHQNKQAEENIRQLNATLEMKITERTNEVVHSEQRFRKLLENNYEAITLLDEKLLPIYRSPATFRLTGWTTEERIKAGGPMDDTHPEDLDRVKATMLQIRNNPGVTVPLTFRTRHKDGHYIWLDGFITNMIHEESLKGILGNFRDITKRKEAEEQVNKLTEELRTLLQHIETSREDERKFIAREIHDELGSALTALKIDVAMMQRKMKNHINDREAEEDFTSVINNIDKTINSVKRISTNLRPEILDHLDLVEAVKWQAQQFINITGVPCAVSHLPEFMNLQTAVSTTVYRTVQEALTNIARHANASSVRILIEQDSKNVLIEVKDNGRGIRKEQMESIKSLGLIGMRERIKQLNGTLSLTGREGKGTVLTVNIPVMSEQEQ